MDEKESLEESTDSESTSDNIENDRKSKPSKSFGRLNSNLKFFEKKMSLDEKGTQRVWKCTVSLLASRKTAIYLHAVNDSKVVYRITNKYAANPRMSLMVSAPDPETNMKAKKEVQTSPAHWCFRKKMGFNDQSDAKRSKIGLSAMYFKMWPKKLLAKTLEDAIINGYCNYLLDPSCSNESWPTYLDFLVEELLESGENMRSRSAERKLRRLRSLGSKRPRPGSDLALSRGERCPGGKYTTSVKWLAYKDRSKRCAFCGKEKAKYKCRSCRSHLCMEPPQEINGKKFPINGPTCYIRYHGTGSYT